MKLPLGKNVWCNHLDICTQWPHYFQPLTRMPCKDVTRLEMHRIQSGYQDSKTRLKMIFVLIRFSETDTQFLVANARARNCVAINRMFICFTNTFDFQKKSLTPPYVTYNIVLEKSSIVIECFSINLSKRIWIHHKVEWQLKTRKKCAESL